MSCHVTPCNAMQCNAMQCNQFHAVQGDTMLQLPRGHMTPAYLVRVATLPTTYYALYAVHSILYTLYWRIMQNCFLHALLLSHFVGPRPARGCATMYQHYHYRGRQLRINNGQVLNNFVRLRFNDQLSGVKVRRGCTLQVFEHVNYRGRRLQFKGRNNCCFRGWWNDKASSAKCTCRGQSSCKLRADGQCSPHAHFHCVHAHLCGIQYTFITACSRNMVGPKISKTMAPTGTQLRQ